MPPGHLRASTTDSSRSRRITKHAKPCTVSECLPQAAANFVPRTFLQITSPRPPQHPAGPEDLGYPAGLGPRLAPADLPARRAQADLPPPAPAPHRHTAAAYSVNYSHQNLFLTSIQCHPHLGAHSTYKKRTQFNSAGCSRNERAWRERLAIAAF